MEITQYRLAKDIIVPALRINGIVHGKRALSANTALGWQNISGCPPSCRFASFGNTKSTFGIPQVWLDLQPRYWRGDFLRPLYYSSRMGTPMISVDVLSSLSSLYPTPSQNRTSSFPTYGSSVYLSACLLPTERVQVFADVHSGPVQQI